MELCAASVDAARSGTLPAHFQHLDESLRRRFSAAPAAIGVFAADPDGAQALLQWRLLSVLGVEGRANTECKETLAWLLADAGALKLFVASGDASGDKWLEALRVLDRIVRADEKSKQGLSLRVAVATALTFAQPVQWMADGSAIDPVARHASYLRWDSEGVLFPAFRELSAWELRYVVGSWSSDADLVWARENIKPELRTHDKVGDAAHMAPYRGHNAQGVSIHAGRSFYDNKPVTLAIMLEYGGVCGTVGRFGTSMSQAFGVPAMPVGQPGHCALIWQNALHSWRTGNDNSGWSGSSCHDGISIPFGSGAWWVRVMQEAQRDQEGFAASEALRVAAALAPQAQRLNVLAQACKRSPCNFTAWKVRCELAHAEKPEAQQALVAAAARAFAQHPLAFDAVLVLCEPSLLGENCSGALAKAHLEECTTTVLAMADAGAEISLSATSLRNMAARTAARVVPDAAEAAKLLAHGDDGHKLVIEPTAADAVIALSLDTWAERAAAAEGKAQEACMSALVHLVRGIAMQPAARSVGLERMRLLLASLRMSKQEAKAKRLTKALLQAASQTGDENFKASVEAIAKPEAKPSGK